MNGKKRSYWRVCCLVCMAILISQWPTPPQAQMQPELLDALRNQVDQLPFEEQPSKEVYFAALGQAYRFHWEQLLIEEQVLEQLMKEAQGDSDYDDQEDRDELMEVRNRKKQMEELWWDLETLANREGSDCREDDFGPNCFFIYVKSGFEAPGMVYDEIPDIAKLDLPSIFINDSDDDSASDTTIDVDAERELTSFWHWKLELTNLDTGARRTDYGLDFIITHEGAKQLKGYDGGILTWKYDGKLELISGGRVQFTLYRERAGYWSGTEKGREVRLIGTPPSE